MESLSIQRYFDIIIFVATTDEREAILRNTKLIDYYIWETEYDKNNEILYTLLLETIDHKILRVALQTLPTMGAESCVFYVSRFLKDFSCSLVCMVGICAGEGNDTCQGDIVIPGKVASISNGKQTGDENLHFKPGNRFHSIEEELRKDLSSFVATDWKIIQKELVERWNKAFVNSKKNLLLTKRKSDDWPKLHFEEKLVMAQVFHVRAYSGSFEDLKDFSSREVIALEMESAALAYTVEKIASRNTRWLIVKGIQDFADGEKDHKYRDFCSWASFSVLISFLRKKLREPSWAHKVSILKRTTVSNQLVSALEEAYRIGNFDQATEIGDTVHRANPDNAAIYWTYIRALLRKQRYIDAAEVINVADYYIAEFTKMNKPLAFNLLSSYLLGKADFFRRIGKIEDSEVYIENILKEAQSHRLKKNCNVAEALYLKGRIAIKRFEDNSNKKYLVEAENYFYDAFCMDPSKYWAGTILLLAKHLQDQCLADEEEMINKVKNTIQEDIKDTPLRPAPRIYLIRLNALLVAANLQDFPSLQRVINKDISDYPPIVLPNCFFTTLENDCRIMFHKPEQRRYHDELLSKIYFWASKIRKY